jgi:hypothetical protein
VWEECRFVGVNVSGTCSNHIGLWGQIMKWLRKVRVLRLVARVGEMRRADRILVGNLYGIRPISLMKIHMDGRITVKCNLKQI